MYQELLTQAGLTENQAQLYEILIGLGPVPAGKIAKNAPFKRGLVYKILDELVQIGLAEEQKEAGKAAKFVPAHPSKLKSIVELREKSLKSAAEALETALPRIVSSFNLTSGKPGIRFYEGSEAIEQIAHDSLTAATEVLTYIDSDALEQYHSKTNEKYVASRVAKGVKKRVLTTDTPYQRAMYAKTKETAQMRFMQMASFPAKTIMQVYDNKISYIVLEPNRVIGVIIEDAIIAQMHRLLFDHEWERATPVTGSQKPPVPGASPSQSSRSTSGLRAFAE